MSDITKKIYSIEPGDADVVRPITPASTAPELPETLPAFVSRPVAPIAVSPSTSSRWVTWTAIGFAALWVLGAGLFFGLKLLNSESTDMLQMAGLATLLILPLLLLIPFIVSGRQLARITNQNAQMAAAAQALVTPSETAMDASKTLAGGIREEVRKLNSQLADTVEVLSGVQKAVTRESQSLDAAGAQLSSRSEDVGRNLTLQRQALETLTGAFDTRMSALSAAIDTERDKLATSAKAAEAVLSPAVEAFSGTATALTDTSSATTSAVETAVAQMGEASRTLNTTGETLKSDLGDTTAQMSELEAQLAAHVTRLDSVNAQAQAKIADLQATLDQGTDMIERLNATATQRNTDVEALYAGLSTQIDAAAETALTSQGHTARMVETNLAQMRREFARMETDMQVLQTQLSNMGAKAGELELGIEAQTAKASRLRLRPLETDFPPVEPPRPAARRSVETPPDLLNLGADMEVADPIAEADREITDFDTNVLRRPGGSSKRNFGRHKSSGSEKDGWRWRDMLGGLDRPDTPVTQSPAPSVSSTPQAAPLQPIPRVETPQGDIVSLLSAMSLSPAAIVDDGTILEATQARINKGERGLAAAVVARVSDPVAHLREKMDQDPALAQQVEHFAEQFAQDIGRTPPAAPALRAALASPKGRAYLLCAAALG